MSIEEMKEFTVTFLAQVGVICYDDASEDTPAVGESLLKYFGHLLKYSHSTLISLYKTSGTDRHKGEYELPQLGLSEGTYLIPIVSEDKETTLSVNYVIEKEIVINAFGSHQKHILIMKTKEPWTKTQWMEMIKKAADYSRQGKPEHLQIHVLRDDDWHPLCSLPKRTLASVYLPKGITETLLSDIKAFWDDKPFYVQHGIPHKYVILLVGPPGTGKTTLIKALACELDYELALMQFGREVNDTSILQMLIDAPPKSFVTIEDVDKAQNARTSPLSLSGILQALDGLVYKNDQILFMTTNNLHKLDDALIRAGRVNKIIHFDYVKEEEVRAMCMSFLPDHDLKKLEKFISKAMIHKFTTATLQDFLLQHRHSKNIVQQFNDFKVIALRSQNKSQDNPLIS